MEKYFKTSVIILVLTASVLPVWAVAATKAPAQPTFIYSAWLPYWKEASSTQEISPYLNKFQEVSPFSFEVKPDGTLTDKLKIGEAPWPDFFALASSTKTKIIPTIAWFNDEAIHALMKDATQRKNHVANIMALVIANNFAGVDIDYENKLAGTKKYFSSFIKELATELHKQKKILSCTVEPRTPLASRFKVIPKSIEYANDYKVLNIYCDEVRVLAYDQGVIDLLLNKKYEKKQPYAPVADKIWAEKVLKETLKTISRKKIVLGVPTYGYEYQLSGSGTNISYNRLHSETFKSAMDQAFSLGIIPGRNVSGELSFTYATSTFPVLAQSSVATSTRFVTFNDAKSMGDKIKLAKKYGLRGVAFFKFDGETDPAIWPSL